MIAHVATIRPVRHLGFWTPTILSLMAARVAGPACFEQKPGSPLGFVDPHLDETGTCYVAVLVAYVMRFTQARCQALVVFAKLGKHIQGSHVIGIIVEDALQAPDVANG